MIESGSDAAGLGPDAFDLPPGTAFRIEPPADPLRPFFTDYHVFDSEGPDVLGAVNWLLPSPPAIRVILADRPIALTLGRRSYDPLPVASLYGSTSRAMRMVSNGGVTVGIGLKALGWARLIDAPANHHRDRLAPLAKLLPPAVVAELVETLRASGGGPGVRAALDGFLARHLGSPGPHDALIGELTALINDDATRDVAMITERLGVSERLLRVIATRYFGFPPKTLLIRTRFVRTMVRLMVAGGEPDYSTIPSTYHDVPHFLRDAQRFLGTTPRRFMRLGTRYLAAVLRARTMALGPARAAAGRG